MFMLFGLYYGFLVRSLYTGKRQRFSTIWWILLPVFALICGHLSYAQLINYRTSDFKVIREIIFRVAIPLTAAILGLRTHKKQHRANIAATLQAQDSPNPGEHL